MAEKEKSAKPAEAPASGGGDEPKKKGGGMKMIMVGAVVVILEVATVGVTWMMSAGPKRAHAVEVPTSAPAEVVEKSVEIPLFTPPMKLPNAQSGRLYLYDIELVAVVEEKNKHKMEEMLKEKKAAVLDRIRTIVASSDPKSLSEPGLETLRRQIGYQLEQDLGHDLVKELLIPKCTPFRAEF